jgi:long-subunit acyl-CoA synthetase (AMP-forming)
MNKILQAISHHALNRPRAVAIRSGNRTINYATLRMMVDSLASRLTAMAPRAIGLFADNGLDWVLADLGAQQAGIPVVPLPGFFSRAQLQYALQHSGIDWVLTDHADMFSAHAGVAILESRAFLNELDAIRIEAGSAAARLPADICKISYTSGTTGTPRGVCLRADAVEQVALSLQQATGANEEDRHVCALPLATLLENIAGVYVPLLAGAECIVPTLAEVGLTGSSGFDVRRQLATLQALQATTVILVPQMLAAQVVALRAGLPAPSTLRFVAVGGGCISARTVMAALELGLPVHEGYGLSECASVVALNRPGDNLPGCVGKPLPHLRVEIAKDGEILVHNANFAGYLDESNPVTHKDLPVATGDLGHFDQAGRLYITGRKKNVFITSFGRNVSPEWVESELLAQRGLLQAIVFGEARPFNAALIFAHPEMDTAQIEAAVTSANAHLPDYARVRHWLRLREPLSAQHGLMTHNGRPRRAAIAEAYRQNLETIFEGKEAHDVLQSAA